jgi:hypothetical protein
MYPYLCHDVLIHYDVLMHYDGHLKLSLYGFHTRLIMILLFINDIIVFKVCRRSEFSREASTIRALCGPSNRSLFGPPITIQRLCHREIASAPCHPAKDGQRGSYERSAG